MIVFRLIFESFRFAVNALKMNPLRTILSLAGVTVGIFVIIGILTVVDSLEKGLKDSFSFLGAGLVYVQKWPFGTGGEYPWWKYMQRPMTTYDEFQFLDENLENYEGICVFSDRGGLTAKHGSNSMNNTSMFGTTFGYKDVFDFNLLSGRYFSYQEMSGAGNAAIIGYNVKNQLFPNQEAVGQEIKMSGLKLRVIGVFEEEGESLVEFSNSDDVIVVPYFTFKKAFATGRYQGSESIIAVKGNENDPELQNLRGQITGLMRSKRGLKPKEEDNFAINRPEMIANQIGQLFDVLTLVGSVIGAFAILIGGFGIANIMFVSVKERTGIIGVQKSLGAKNYFILLQFLFEAVFLSMIGGVVGLLMVYFITFIDIGRLELMLNFGNVIFALVIVGFIGVASGIWPAFSASRMDPVIAIRSN